MKLIAWPSMRILGLAIISLTLRVAAMEYVPFPFCTETHQVDSIAYIEESSGSGEFATPKAEGFAFYTYHPHTCILANIRQHTIFDDEILTQVKPTTSGYIAHSWKVDSTPTSEGFWARIWFTPDGNYDSVFHFEDSLSMSDLSSAKRIFKHKKTPPYEILEEYYPDSVGELKRYLVDSVLVEGNTITVMTTEELESYKTTCTNNGTTVACLPEPIGNVSWMMTKKIWHHSRGRMDSLQVFDLQDSLIRTEKYFWSERLHSAIHHGKRPRAMNRTLLKWNRNLILGRTPGLFRQ